MRKSGLLSTSAIGSAAIFGLSLGCASPAFAEDNLEADVAAAAAQGDAAADQGEQAITVTGSRIRRPNLDSAVPIASIAGDTFVQQGNNNIGDTLNELPQLRTTFAQQNPGLGIGISGLNLLDLRGLAPVRTLVLVNGRRHVPGDFTSNISSVDINTIPNDLIERVDIVTGGNSAIYGSDAIAGVVNFVLRRDFEGIQVRGLAGISTPGNYGGNQYVSAMYGMNFGEGRGNITLHAEYARQDIVFASDIPFLRRVDGLILVDQDPAGTPNGSDGIPDRVFGRDIRARNTNLYGLIPLPQTLANPACGLGVAPTPATQTPYNCLLVFGPDGSLAPSDETGRYSTGPIGGAIGGTRLGTGRELNLLLVLPRQERYNANLLARYAFSDAFELFTEAKFTRIETAGGQAGPNPLQGTFTQFDARERIRLDNPFLTPAQRTTIANAILASGCNTSLTQPCTLVTANSGPLTPAQIAAIAAGTYRFALARSILDSDLRTENFRRDTYRFVAGLRGTFNDDWSYELSANYGRSEESTVTSGYFDRQRFLLSLDAGRNPVTGAIQCRSQFDPASAIAFPNNAGNQARLAADVAACIPYNPFGAADNSAAVAYFTRPYFVDGLAEQLVFSGFVSGDSSQLFELWGGPIRFALGAEYRWERAFVRQDDFACAGNSTAVAFCELYSGSTDVKEAFAELQLPILRDVPFFHELTVTGAARIAEYPTAGTVWAYNAGVEWSPVPDIRFRGNYSRAVRAPNITETSGGLTPNFAPGFVDPCSPGAIGTGSATRAANCQTDLGPLLGNIVQRAYGLPVLTGSNPDLGAESSDSWTIGTVIQPRWVPGLSISVDYFDITVNNVIVNINAQTIANSCYDLPDLNNPFCALFERFRGPGVGPQNEVPGDILGNTLIQAPANFASRVRRGIDTQISYRTNITDNVRLNTTFIYTHNFQTSNFQDPTRPNFENRILGELGDPVDEFRWDVDVGIDQFTLGYRMRYIGPMYVNLWEDFNGINGLPPADADYADIRKYPETFYHDFRIEWNVRGGGPNLTGRPGDLQFYVGVDNVLNTPPPLGVAGTGGGGAGNDRVSNGGAAIYDIRGRNFYAGFRARF